MHPQQLLQLIELTRCHLFQISPLIDHGVGRLQRPQYLSNSTIYRWLTSLIDYENQLKQIYLMKVE